MRKRHTPDQIAHLLRGIEAEVAGGGTVAQACQKLGVSEQTFYRWRSQSYRPQVDRPKRLKELEAENTRLKKLVAELALEKLALQEVLRGKS
jgi:transposase-like protein